MIFMAIFNFLEPAVTIIAQTIPMFRVLIVKAKKVTGNTMQSSPSSGITKSTLIQNKYIVLEPLTSDTRTVAKKDSTECWS